MCNSYGIERDIMPLQLGLAHDTTPTVDEVMEIWNGHSKIWLTRKEIADCLARSKSPTLIAVIGIAVGMGLLARKTTRLPNGVDMFQYRPTEKWKPGSNAF